MSRSYDSSSTERYRTNEQTKITVQELQEDKNGFNQTRTKSEPFQGEKRDSWWFWGDSQKENQKQKRTDDTCSCVSCALKKIAGSEYTCVACLFILFSISVAIIFLTVCKTISCSDATDVKCDDDSLVNKMRVLKEKRQLTENYGWSDYTERSRWDDSNLGRLSAALESDYGGDGIKNSNSPELSRLSGDLANVLSSQKIIEGRKSDRLREFFKKLIQTDTQIRKLKQDMNNNYLTDTKAITDRFKRSASKRQRKHNKEGDLHKNLDRDTTNDATATTKESNTHSRPNDTGVTRVWIKNEQIVIKYIPERRRNFPKCSHSHQTKNHEKQLKHPFYKNSQRIDEMLYEKKTTRSDKVVEDTKYANTNLNVVKNKNVNRKEKKLTDKNNSYDSIDVVLDGERAGFGPNTTDFNVNKHTSTLPTYHFALTVSTLISQMALTEKPPRKHTPVERPGHRRLMQVDDEEDKEDLVYEDLKEVLEDEGQSQDDIDKQVERNKRDDKYDPEPLANPSRYSAQNTHNTNWKGPMPLYPDEINAAIKQMSIQNMHQLPVDTKAMKQEKERPGKDVSDTEYIENYADSKYNKMLKMAQAYSDYGVLYGKKDRSEPMKDNDENDQYNKLKPYINKESLMDRFFKRSKKDSYEGFSFQRRSGETSNEKDELMKSISKHIKFVKDTTKTDNCKQMTETTKDTHFYVTPESAMQTNDVIFNWKKSLRSLKSIENPDDVNNTDEAINPLINNNDSDANDNKVGFSTDGLLSFISMLTDWLINLPNLSINGKIEDSKVNSSDTNQKSRYNATEMEASKVIRDVNETQGDFNYPSYDSDMVDNIGHRSRVLMSIEDKKSVNNMPLKNDPAHTSTETDNIIPVALVLVKNDKENITKHKGKNISNSVQIKKENKTIVKRNADHQSVVWNDLYDDEYGVNVDYSQNIRDKHSAKKGRNVVRQSRDWFQNRFKNLTNKFKFKFANKSPNLSKNITSSPSTLVNTPKRTVRQTNNNADADIKKSFADLTENMKKVCQEAVRAVQDTKNIEVREEKKEDGAATSLMQQLVRLMTDLVDIQVQQKNCAKLPSDLYKFLEWLTVPQDTNFEINEVFPGQSYTIDDSVNRYEKSTYPSYDITLTEDTHQEDRTECLGTIRAVQDLIQQYEGMSDEDKSKMTGVKEYLENQLKFLNRKLSGFAETNVSA
ncbi:uncharacterized protein LOC124540929 [Vanessa cardui]|uniref:uncharacterized protein LOC124540929 n=1 Tax=Vanessa cardui TaxID=171605 RepID=UPI001F147B21|nr:uncharacterized protein LOC124540929 [Vanessa cardui]